jgi:hypothetical protein
MDDPDEPDVICSGQFVMLSADAQITLRTLRTLRSSHAGTAPHSCM